jgi:DNA repair exonuclease SbcCD ATPase subunit
MKKKLYIILVLATTFAFTTCSNDGQNTAKLNERIDSLEKENARKDESLQDLNLFVGALADGFDSIAKHEEMLFYTNKGKEGVLIDREQLKKNLEMFENLLEQQEQRINQLTDSLRLRGVRINRLQSLVDYMNQQIEEKNNIIKKLRTELNNKDANISQLHQKVSELTDSTSKLSIKVETQRDALDVQSEMINECYVKIGTKKELSDMGIISGGFLREKKVIYDAFQKEQFMQVDIRKFTEITIESRSPKILTQMPKTSYRIERNGDKSTLYITDPTEFWKVSNFLIIQTK